MGDADAIVAARQAFEAIADLPALAERLVDVQDAVNDYTGGESTATLADHLRFARAAIVDARVRMEQAEVAESLIVNGTDLSPIAVLLPGNVTVQVGATIRLDARGSRDQNFDAGDGIESWDFSFVSQPEGETATYVALDPADAEQRDYTPSVVGTHELKVLVTNARALTDEVTITLTVQAAAVPPIPRLSPSANFTAGTTKRIFAAQSEPAPGRTITSQTVAFVSTPGGTPALTPVANAAYAYDVAWDLGSATVNGAYVVRLTTTQDDAQVATVDKTFTRVGGGFVIPGDSVETPQDGWLWGASFQTDDWESVWGPNDGSRTWNEAGFANRPRALVVPIGGSAPIESVGGTIVHPIVGPEGLAGGNAMRVWYRGLTHIGKTAADTPYGQDAKAGCGHEGHFGWRGIVGDAGPDNLGGVDECWLRYYVFIPEGMDLFGADGNEPNAGNFKFPGLAGKSSASIQTYQPSYYGKKDGFWGSQMQTYRSAADRTAGRVGQPTWWLNVQALGATIKSDTTNFSRKWLNPDGSAMHMQWGWNLLEFYYQMNTPGVSDGVIEGWLNGVLGFRSALVRYRNNTADGQKLNVNMLRWNTHYGGNNCSVGQEYLYFSDVVIARTRPGPRLA